MGASYWRGANADQVDAPILGVTYGITNRVQLSATVPFYRATYKGLSGGGLDTIYISGKIAIVDPDAGDGRFGLAIGAGAEILSPVSPTPRARTGSCLLAWSSGAPRSVSTDRLVTFHAGRSSRPVPSNGPHLLARPLPSRSRILHLFTE